MTTYVITLSRTFPGTHPRKGEQTLFVAKLVEMLKWNPDNPKLGSKLHTIRGNYLLWSERIRFLAKKYNIGKTQVGYIKQGKRWME